jgi:hypothetical protein
MPIAARADGGSAGNKRRRIKGEAKKVFAP